MSDDLELNPAANEEVGEHVVEAETEPTPEEPVLAPRLVVKRGGVETEDIFQVHSPCIIGRFDPSVGPIDVDLGSLPEGVYVSRKHARITQEDGEWKLTDLGSSNGTFVLGDDFERVEECALADGTEFALGNARFIFKLS